MPLTVASRDCSRSATWRILTLSVLVLTPAGCGDSRDPLEKSFDAAVLSTLEARIYGDLWASTLGETREDEATGMTFDEADLSTAVDLYVDAVREQERHLGRGELRRKLADLASSVEPWCESCARVLERERELLG